MPPLDRFRGIHPEIFPDEAMDELRRNQRAIDELHRMVIDQAMQQAIPRPMTRRDIEAPVNTIRHFYNGDQWETIVSDYGKSFTPDPKKVVSIDEEDSMPIDYDTDEDAEKASLVDNKVFHKKIQSVLDEVSTLYEELSTNVLDMTKNDKYYKENSIIKYSAVDRIILHYIYSMYKEGVKDLSNAKDGILYRQKISYNSFCEANTYIYKNMQSIIDMSFDTFNKIMKLGDIKMTPYGNEVVLIINGTEYSNKLNRKW